jgi:hypothetical protein
MTDEPPKKRRTWIPIVIGVVILLGFVAIGIVGVGLNYLRQSMTVTDASEADASSEFDKVHARFPGQQPLIQLVDGRPQYVTERASQSASQTTLNTLHVLAYDRDKGQTVTFTLPFWLLRMKSGPIRISAYQQGWDDRGVSFRVEDIEKHGPGIIVDATGRRDGRVLIWAE